ncbi:MAG: hypothetical protein M3Q97_09390 [Bacteroidota bacterium]|nr:hypothetical protein [Bacteroidota bacterium]
MLPKPGRFESRNEITLAEGQVWDSSNAYTPTLTNHNTTPQVSELHPVMPEKKMNGFEKPDIKIPAVIIIEDKEPIAPKTLAGLKFIMIGLVLILLGLILVVVFLYNNFLFIFFLAFIGLGGLLVFMGLMVLISQLLVKLVKTL